MKLEGKSIVVTGASAGMGQAIVTLFAQEGANIIAVARRKERLEALAEELKDAPGKVVPYAGDVSDPAVCEGMIDAAVKEFGRLDVLVNNAGFGISGAIQHLAGIGGAKTIIAVNTDPDAPIFGAATYKIVGDAAAVLKALIEQLQQQ